MTKQPTEKECMEETVHFNFNSIFTLFIL